MRTLFWLIYALIVWTSGCFVLWAGCLRESPNMWMTHSDYPIWFLELIKHSYLRLVGAQVAQTLLIGLLADVPRRGLRDMPPIHRWCLGLIALQLLLIIANTLR